MNQEAFLYCWTDTKSNKLYVGTHKGSTDDGYVCSGKLMLEQYDFRPEDFSREIIAKGLYDDMISFECAILKSANAAKDLGFYNQHNGDGNFFCKYHTETTKAKIKLALLNHKRTEEHSKAISLSKKNKIPKCVFTRRSFAGENNPNYGKSNKNINETNYTIKDLNFKGAKEVSAFFQINKQEVYRRVGSNIEKWKDWNVLGKQKNYIKKQKIKRPDLTKRNLENNPAKSEEAKQKMRGPRPSVTGSLSHRWGISLSPETRALISAKNKGKKQLPHSEIAKQKMSEAKKKYWMDRKNNIGN